MLGNASQCIAAHRIAPQRIARHRKETRSGFWQQNPVRVSLEIQRSARQHKAAHRSAVQGIAAQRNAFSRLATVGCSDFLDNQTLYAHTGVNELFNRSTF